MEYTRKLNNMKIELNNTIQNNEYDEIMARQRQRIDTHDKKSLENVDLEDYEFTTHFTGYKLQNYNNQADDVVFIEMTDSYPYEIRNGDEYSFKSLLYHLSQTIMK
eukprot:729328_1